MSSQMFDVPLSTGSTWQHPHLLCPILYLYHSPLHLVGKTVPRPQDILIVLCHHFWGVAAGQLRVHDIMKAAREYLHADSQMAYHLWVLMYPIVWATLEKQQQATLAKPIIALLSKEYHHKQAAARPNVIQVQCLGTSMHVVACQSAMGVGTPGGPRHRQPLCAATQPLKACRSGQWRATVTLLQHRSRSDCPPQLLCLHLLRLCPDGVFVPNLPLAPCCRTAAGVAYPPVTAGHFVLRGGPQAACQSAASCRPGLS